MVSHEKTRPRSIGVQATRFQAGADNLSDPVEPLHILPIEEVFETAFETDAHYSCYQPIGNFNQDHWPRINKPVLPRLRAVDADLALHILPVDFDNPGHLPWSSPEAVEFWISQLAKAAEDFPLADQWACLHTTKNGARLVYLLRDPVSPEQFEAKHKWLCQEFNRRGFEVDLTVSDWTRVFRAPLVVRDRARSWEAEEFKIVYSWDRTIHADALGSAFRQSDSKYAPIIPILDPKPKDSVAIDLLFEMSAHTSRQVQSEWFKSAKARMKGRECFPTIFGSQMLATKGERNSALHKHLGQAIGVLYYLQGTTPEHIYSLFLDPVRRLEPDRDTPDWTDVLWDHITRLWAKEDAKAREALEREEEKAQIAEDHASLIVRGMREWCEHPDLFSSDPEVVQAFVERRMIVQHGRSYFPIQSNGRYINHPLLQEQIIPWLRSHGMDSLMQTVQFSEDGIARDIPRETLINRFAVPVKEVTGVPQIEGGYITPDDRMVVGLYRRNPHLVPEFNNDVDTWLAVLFGEEYDRVRKWLGYALAFEDGPICALSILGEPGCGKKMFVQGLAECLENPWVADADDIVSDYQYGLLRTPFLAVNEGWPTQRARHPADTFRRLVGGDGLLANQKFHAPIRVKNPVRVIFAANNLDVVGFLTGGRDLSPEDRDALQIRLLHFDVGGDASLWLRSRGGARFTAGWIEGDGGRPSKYTVAKHFLYLHATRSQFGPPEPRLLVEGRANSSLMFAMRTQSGRGPLVVESIIKLLNTDPGRGTSGIAIEDGNLYVLASEILDYYRQRIAPSVRGESLTAKAIGNALKGLVEVDLPSPITLKSRDSLGRKRWHRLDPEMLQDAAQRDGWKCPRLDSLVEERAKRKEGQHVEKAVVF
jgi:hypothetical protein